MSSRTRNLTRIRPHRPRHRRLKAIASCSPRLALLLIAAQAIIGCDPPTATVPGQSGGVMPDRTVRIAYVGFPAGDPEWRMIEKGARHHASRYSQLILDVLTPRHKSATELEATVAAYLPSRPDAVLLSVRDPRVALPAAKRVLESNLRLITVGTRIESLKVFGHVDVYLTDAADRLGLALPELVKPHQSYLLLHDRGRTPTATRCYQRFDARAARYFALTRLMEANSFESGRTAFELIPEMVKKFPNAGLLVTLEPSFWMRASAAQIRELPCRFATLGTHPHLWRYLRSGVAVALAGPIHPQIGAVAVESAFSSVTAEEPQGFERIIACELVTAETLDDFAERYAQAAGVPLSSLLPAPSPASQPAGGGRP
ncbi:MAG: hypothetical protein D6744_01210 [Planctomycetota bacterium]|nr:MAG: hypothetical protein D6744_01210 [Planctomycetota bacterium]